jgi:NAD(P)-dependent dehydrogenase (short-subunit alcohol dehydrogenase family)
MLVSLLDRVVVVTGGARRVGRHIALEFARQGADVAVIHSQSPDEAAHTAADIRALGRRAHVVQADITRFAEVEAAFAAIAAAFGRVDVLVNNASNFYSGDLLDMPVEEWDHALAVNTSGAYYCTRQAGRLMRDAGQGGAIVNIGDNGGLRPWSRRPAHSVSKAGLIMLTQVTARALAPYQIRCNCLVMGPMIPVPGTPPEAWEKTVARLPLARSGDGDDAARAAVFAATNSFMTGAVVHIDGGEGLV